LDTFEAIKKRRSVRQYTGAPIPKEALIKIVDAGRWAPSGYNRQPWDFIVVTDRDMIQALKIASQWMENAAAIIAVVLDTGASKFWLEDGAAAVENMLLASTALGYGSCWLQGYTEPREAEFKRLLDVPEGKRLLTLIPIGVPTHWPEGEKKPLGEVLHWEKYGRKTHSGSSSPSP
jgi:nitroreductase